MITHMLNTQTQRPVCWGKTTRPSSILHTTDVDKVDCVICLRKMLKDAVMFGNGRKARRW